MSDTTRRRFISERRKKRVYGVEPFEFFKRKKGCDGGFSFSSAAAPTGMDRQRGDRGKERLTSFFQASFFRSLTSSDANGYYNDPSEGVECATIIFTEQPDYDKSLQGEISLGRVDLQVTQGIWNTK